MPHSLLFGTQQPATMFPAISSFGHIVVFSDEVHVGFTLFIVPHCISAVQHVLRQSRPGSTAVHAFAPHIVGPGSAEHSGSMKPPPPPVPP